MATRIRFNPQRGQYINVDGIALDEKLVLETMLERIEASKQRNAQYAAALANGDFSVSDFNRAMDTEINNLNLQLYALGRGGWETMTPDDYLRAQAIINEEIGFRQGFSADIASGKLSAAQLEARMNLYPEHAWQAYFAGQGIAKQRAGFTQERRVLQPAEHCEDCERYAGLGWQPLGTLPKPGRDSACKANCKCIMEYQ